MSNEYLIDKLSTNGSLSKNEWISLIKNSDGDSVDYAANLARETSLRYFGKNLYIRGLIEFSNYCKNDCYYCGIRRSNKSVQRYRMDKEEILNCCDIGYGLGVRTFVLQSGEEDDDFRIVSIIEAIKIKYPDCAITLSLGEKSRKVYEAFYCAGADRYLLRHETADNSHYAKLHPPDMSLENRKKCLSEIKEIGFQTGCGFMAGAPYQTPESLADDMLFIKEMEPAMVGIGPFIPHSDTPFGDKTPGSIELTLFLLSLTRIMLKNVLLPATTALATLCPTGRERGILSGANVIMPNLSPKAVRDKYTLYNNKICTGEEAAETINNLSEKVSSLGYGIVTDRGDWKPID